MRRSPDHSAPESTVLSAPMVEDLTSLATDAVSRLEEPTVAALFRRWHSTFGADLPKAEAHAFFAGEAAFAAAARMVLDVQLGALPTRQRAFPHIYGSTLFSWYEPEPTLRSHLEAALDGNVATDPLEVLGALYERSIPLSVRKRFGQFYTSRPLVTAMLDNVGFMGTSTLSSRLIDPACGAGAFLIEATRRVLAAADAEGLSDAEACIAVQRVIHGLDLNPLGVLLTEAAIALLLAPRLARAGSGLELSALHLYVTDTLRTDVGLLDDHADGAAQIKARVGTFADGFTHVVANPPYAKLPSRLMNAEQRRRFAQTTFGHPNLYGLFLQAGVELLSDRGRLSFINPKSFVSGLYFRNLRRFLKARLDIQCLDSFSKRSGLFDGVLQEVIILTGTASNSQSDAVQLREFVGPPDGAPARSVAVKSSSVLLGESFDHAFFTAVDPLAHRMLARMTEASQPLGTCGIKVLTGTIVWNRLKPHVRNEAADDVLPLVWGNGVRYFRFAGTGNRAGAATHMALVEKTRNIVTYGDAVLVKRMTASEEPRRLVACRIPQQLADSTTGYFVENHVNVIRASGDAQIDLDAVLGLLNSDLFDYVFRALNGNTNVSATELALLPVVLGPELERIAGAARQLSASGGSDAEALRALNDAVYQLYGIEREGIRELDGSPTLALAA